MNGGRNETQNRKNYDDNLDRVRVSLSLSERKADDFYKGKTIRFIVGAPAGGGYDTYTRAIGRHLGKHIPGNPSMVVENMDGAGSLIAANYTYNKAERDGLAIGVWISGQIIRQALGDRSPRFDGRKFGWIGAPSKGSPDVRDYGLYRIQELE